MHLITSGLAQSLSKTEMLPMPSYPYIATPFSHKRMKVMQKRYKAAVTFSAALYKIGQPHYNPIVNTFPPSVILQNSNDSDFWVEVDSIVLRKCDGLWIVMAPEWASSKGIAREIEEFRNLMIIDPVKYKAPIRFYTMESIMNGDLHTFQVVKGDEKHLPTQLPK